jgi:hypothetical protein
MATSVNGQLFIPFNFTGQAPYSLALRFDMPDKTVPSGCREIRMTVDVR